MEKGIIYRKFEIYSGCGFDDVPADHAPDTIVRYQRIWVGNDCPIEKYMFAVPYDTTIYTCGLLYDEAGNVDFDQMGMSECSW